MSATVKTLSEKQLGILERFGYDTNAIGDEEGIKIIDEIAANKWQPLKNGPTPTPEATQKPALRPDGPATKKQIAVLKKYDYDTDGVTFEQASALIDELAENGWKKPDGDDL